MKDQLDAQYWFVSMRKKILSILALLALVAAMQAVGAGPTTVEAQPRVQVRPQRPSEEEVVTARPAEGAAEPREAEPGFKYPINLSPVGEVVPKIEWDEETKIATVVGRFYLWQKQDEKGGLLELQADNAVIFSVGEQLVADRDRGGAGDILAKGAASAIYMSGDIVMTEGRRTIRAYEMYYDFERKKAIAIKAVMRNFNITEGMPIYVRAAKLRRLSEKIFTADNITLTTSEFYLPQISLNASSVIITDTTTIDEQEDRVSKSSYEALMHDVSMKMYDKTIFYLPVVHSNLEQPDTAARSAHAGYDSTWGAVLETRWYLARLLGLQEPEGMDSTFALDYYSKRGVGSGVDINYARENHFGRILGYGIHDRGEDRLGRAAGRRDLKSPRELRGRFFWQHRHFLPYNWQFTSEVSYTSDQNFIESFYRSEFNVGKEQETLVHLKRIEDNWGLSFLGKVRINDFVNKLEELPTAEFHWTGQSLLDDKLTFYSDSQVSRFRQRMASGSSTVSQKFFTFASERAELDMPMTIGKAKVVPFVAGTVAYEDGLGFYRELGGATAGREDNVYLGEAGFRASSQPYWKVFPDVKSRLWDLNQLRHVIRPYLTAVGFTESDSVIEQRDMLNVGISQRLQTKRGTGNKARTVDWMRLDMDVTLVNDSATTSPAPDRFIWNKPFIPLMNRFGGAVPLRDRRSSDMYGPRRNYFGADYIWRLSDTSAVLSDMNFDMQSAVMQQFNVGFSHLRWPNLSYYIGSRYLRRLVIGNEKGSNAFTFALTYMLDPRYTVVFSQQYDFDYGANIRREIALIRRYHRVYCGLTYSVDDSMDRHSIVFSIWPQGVPELAIGQRRYMRLTR
ncbi:MAG: LPS assembly protein LptD [Planctomycetota bacterium]